MSEVPTTDTVLSPGQRALRGYLQGFLLLGAIAVLRTLIQGYDPMASVRESGVLCGDNRIVSLKLVSVRKYLPDGSFESDTTTRTLIGD